MRSVARTEDVLIGSGERDKVKNKDDRSKRQKVSLGPGEISFRMSSSATENTLRNKVMSAMELEFATGRALSVSKIPGFQ